MSIPAVPPCSFPGREIDVKVKPGMTIRYTDEREPEPVIMVAGIVNVYPYFFDDDCPCELCGSTDENLTDIWRESGENPNGDLLVVPDCMWDHVEVLS